jgi:hypothetical protein
MKFPTYFPRLFRPSVYQGKSSPKNYFEGWYYKHVDKTGEHIWSIIFGVSHSKDSHSFIQVIEGKSGKTDYLRFKKEDFSYRKDVLEVCIGANKITENYIKLDLQGENFSIKGKIDYSDNSQFPQSILSPGIMGWYSYAPFMECYHGVVSMNHVLKGAFIINGKEIDFTGGKGYIEKDWGKSMPSDWIWLQCNHFENQSDVSLMISLARIPWLTGHFPGFLSFVTINNEVYRFATYNNSKIKTLKIENDKVELLLANKKHTLSVLVERKISGVLKAPVKGEMERKIAESLDANISIKLHNRKGDILYEGEGKHAGLEIVGDVSQYIL